MNLHYPINTEVFSKYFLSIQPIITNIQYYKLTEENIRNFHIRYYKHFKRPLREHTSITEGSDSEKTFLVNIILELLKNSMEYAPIKNVNFHASIALWFNNNEILLAYRDNGSFYGLESTKIQLESGIAIATTRESGGGHGTQRFCKYGNKLFVDTKDRTLYLLYNTKEVP